MINGGRMIRFEPGESRLDNPRAWYRINRDRLNRVRRKRRRKRRDHFNAKSREWYAVNGSRLFQLSPQGKYVRKLRRAGFSLPDAKKIAGVI